MLKKTIAVLLLVSIAGLFMLSITGCDQTIITDQTKDSTKVNTAPKTDYTYNRGSDKKLVDHIDRSTEVDVHYYGRNDICKELNLKDDFFCGKGIASGSLSADAEPMSYFKDEAGNIVILNKTQAKMIKEIIRDKDNNITGDGGVITKDNK